jgi:glycerol-3-phosphate dehydrogenase
MSEPARPPHPSAPLTDRERGLQALRRGARWDLVVVGGGATGLGVALDAAARGLQVLLLEAADFGQGTSSRSTKLVHGGVRYLAQGHIGLVREALTERAALLAHAPHLAQPLAFVVPGYRWWELPFYGAGLKAYAAMAGRRSLGRTELLSVRATEQALPNLLALGLRGGIRYWDGQFDDARLAVVLARTAAQQGAVVLNHLAVTALRHQGGRVTGVCARDTETGESFEVEAACVVNATGVWVDGLRQATPSSQRSPLVTPSQGVHLVVDRAFLPGMTALMVPKTADGRVLFAVPWLGKTLLGTTDTPRADVPAEPRPFGHEVDFILGEAARYLKRAPTRADVRSAWVGLRPLVRPQQGGEGDGGPAGGTRSLSREHTVEVGPDGLVTVTGGKWTTYRAMAEDVLSTCMARGLLPQRQAGLTQHLRLLGAPSRRAGVASDARQSSRSSMSSFLPQPPGEHLYGSEAAVLQELPGARRALAHDAETGQPVLSEAMVRFAVRFEMARSVEDVLARRSRLLFLDALQALACAEAVAQILADELGPAFDAEASADDFKTLAARYADVPA